VVPCGRMCSMCIGTYSAYAHTVKHAGCAKQRLLRSLGEGLCSTSVYARKSSAQEYVGRQSTVKHTGPEYAPPQTAQHGRKSMTSTRTTSHFFFLHVEGGMSAWAQVWMIAESERAR
jgi:hypothetical protein